MLTLLVMLMQPSESPIVESPIVPPPEAIERYVRRGTTVVEAEATPTPLPPLPRLDDGTVDRHRIVQTLRREMFGTVPPLTVRSSVSQPRRVTFTNGAEAVHRTVTLQVTGDAGCAEVMAPLFQPTGDGPFPCFVFLDHRSQADDTPEDGPEATDYWDVPRILAAGCATVAVRVDEVDPDDRTPNFDDGLHALMTSEPDPDWSTLAIWAWAMSEVRKAIAADPAIGPCYAIGHSRGGKTALWAAASDEGFAGAVSNESGCGGAALSRRRIGETVRIINTSFPHWFNARFKRYNDRESKLPHDQHWLLAAIAPRKLAVGSAAADYWADPYGEWLAVEAASEAWPGDAAAELGRVPAIGDVRRSGPVQYHLREGRHGLRAEDWDRYLEWAVGPESSSGSSPSVD